MSSEPQSGILLPCCRRFSAPGAPVSRAGPTGSGRFSSVSTITTDNLFLNYAIPDDGAEPTNDEIGALIAAFANRRRRPRLEYVTPSPGVERALATAGFATTFGWR